MSDSLHEQIATELVSVPMSALWLITTSSTKELKAHLLQQAYSGPIQEFALMRHALSQLPQYAGEHALIVIQNDRPELYSYL